MPHLASYTPGSCGASVGLFVERCDTNGLWRIKSEFGRIATYLRMGLGQGGSLYGFCDPCNGQNTANYEDYRCRLFAERPSKG